MAERRWVMMCTKKAILWYFRSPLHVSDDAMHTRWGLISDFWYLFSALKLNFTFEFTSARRASDAIASWKQKKRGEIKLKFQPRTNFRFQIHNAQKNRSTTAHKRRWNSSVLCFGIRSSLYESERNANSNSRVLCESIWAETSGEMMVIETRVMKHD